MRAISKGWDCAWNVPQRAHGGSVIRELTLLDPQRSGASPSPATCLPSVCEHAT